MRDTLYPATMDTGSFSGQKDPPHIECADCNRRRAMMMTIEIIGKTSGFISWAIGMIIEHEAGGFAYVKDCSNIGFFPS